MFSSSNRRQQRPDQTAQLPGRLCLALQAAAEQRPMVGPADRRTAEWRPLQQCSGFATAVCLQRGTGGLGRSEFHQCRHRSDLWPPGKPQPPGGLPAAADSLRSDRTGALAWGGSPAVCRNHIGVGSNSHTVHLQPRRLAGNGCCRCRAAVVAAAALDTPLASALETSCASGRAAGWSRLPCGGGHPDRSDPHAHHQPAGGTGG